MVHAVAFCGAAVPVDLRRVPRCHAGNEHILLPRLRLFRLPAGALSSRGVLAGRIAFLESFEQLWPSTPRAVEHDDAVPAVAHLLGAPDAVGARLLLPRPPRFRRRGDVLPRAPL